MTTRWDDLTRAQQAKAREIRDWAASLGAAVSTSQVAADLDTWEDAHAAGRLPAGTRMVPVEPQAGTPLGKEASLAAYRMVTEAGEAGAWALGSKVWRLSRDSRVWCDRDEFRWVYLGDGEFRLSVTCRHCGERFGVGGVVDATTYSMRSRALRDRHGVCPDCRPLLRPCGDCGAEHVPAADRGNRCPRCHAAAARGVADEAARIAHAATLPE